MTHEQMTAIRRLEGHELGIALSDGSRIDSAALMSVERPDRATVWVYCNGNDMFIPTAHVAEVWESCANPRLDRANG